MSSSHIQARSFSLENYQTRFCESAVAASWSAYWLFDLLAAVFADEYFADELVFGHVSDFVAGVGVARVAPCAFLTHAKHERQVCARFEISKRSG
jgi:hypothetical protein